MVGIAYSGDNCIFNQSILMSKTVADIKPNRENPFLTDKADALWERLDKNGKPVSKEELLRKASELKRKKRI